MDHVEMIAAFAMLNAMIATNDCEEMGVNKGESLGVHHDNGGRGEGVDAMYWEDNMGHVACIECVLTTARTFEEEGVVFGVTI